LTRKPVKKRKLSAKRSRKPVKAKPTFGEIFRSALAKKPKPLNPKFRLKIGTTEDPFFIHPETIPDGVALQWVLPEPSAMREALRAGWKPVKEQDEVGGQVLVWASKEVARAQADVDIGRAKQQMADARALFGMDGQKPSPYHGSIKIVGSDFVETKVYESVPSDAPSIDIDVTIKFRVSARWQDAAASLGIEVNEYTRRRLLMESVVLGPCGIGDCVINGVYEPVQLFTKRMD